MVPLIVILMNVVIRARVVIKFKFQRHSRSDQW
jgi:hypothetical protein